MRRFFIITAILLAMITFAYLVFADPLSITLHSNSTFSTNASIYTTPYGYFSVGTNATGESEMKIFWSPNSTNVSMSNVTMNYWTANMTAPFEDTPNGQWYNFTIHANASNNISNGRNFTSQGPYLFRVDTMTPILNLTNASVFNNTIDNFYMVNFTIMDNNTATCGIDIFDNDNVKYQFGSLNKSVTTGVQTNCNASFMSNITGFLDGNMTIRAWANDTVKHNISVDIPALYSRITANNWTFLSYGDDANITVQNLLNKFPSATQIAVFDNNASKKSYTTYLRSIPSTNNMTNVSRASVFAIYSTSNLTYIRNATSFISADANVSVDRGGWNLINLFKNGNLNQSMYIDFASTAKTNISAMSYFNRSSGYWVSCVRTMALCTGGVSRDPTATTVTPDLGIWIYTNFSAPINRSLPWS